MATSQGAENWEGLERQGLGRKDGVMERAGLESEFESQFLSLTRQPEANDFTQTLKCVIYKGEIIGAP